MIHIHDGQQIAAYLAIATYPRSYCSLAPPHLPHPPRAFVPLPKNASNPGSCCVEAQKGDSSVAVNFNWPRKTRNGGFTWKKPEFCTAADIEKWWIWIGYIYIYINIFIWFIFFVDKHSETGCVSLLDVQKPKLLKRQKGSKFRWWVNAQTQATFFTNGETQAGHWFNIYIYIHIV